MTKSVKKKLEEALAKQEEALAREKEALARAKEEVEKLKGLLLERDKALGKKHQEKLTLRKLLRETSEKHENMCVKAEDFERKYKNELILKEALFNDNQELVIVKAQVEHCNIKANEMREERDNAIKLVNEITTTKQVEAFICPISQEVMKDPHMTSDGYTYEADVIKRWLDTHNTSPMTNIKLSHTKLVPNRALRSAIEELVFPTL